ncbi:variable surface protein, partial [Plasmodium gonderi]
KLDCYCEKKIFNHIDKMCKFANRADVNKSTFKKKLFKKYGMQIFLTNFFYFISLLIAVFECLFLNNILLDTSNGNTHLISNDIARHIVKTLGDILLYVVPFVLTLVIIYILIKIIKYEKLKSKNGKMSAKECYSLFM